MKKPELTDFGLTEEEYLRARRNDESFPTSLFVLVLGYLVLYRIAEKEITGLSFGSFATIFGDLVGSLLIAMVIKVGYDSIANRVVPVRRKAVRYKKELDEYHEWVVRAQRQFWLSLSGREFEHELARLFIKIGMRAEVTPCSGDEGVDIWLYTPNGREIVQCKAHKTPVGPAVVRELYGAMQAHNVNAGRLASLAGFTKGVYRFAQGKPIQLIDLDEVLRLQNQIHRKITTNTVHNEPMQVGRKATTVNNENNSTITKGRAISKGVDFDELR